MVELSQLGAVIKTAYEAEPDTNAFTDAEKNKLTSITGSNTGDETTSSIQTKRPLKTIASQSLEGSGNVVLNKTDVGLGNVDNVSATDLRDRATHTGTQTANTISDFSSSVRSAVLTGLSLVTGGVISATDSILAAFGKLQNQVTALGASKQDTLISGTNIKTLENQSLLGSGNIDLTKSDVGLGNVDNTSDFDKPVSSSQESNAIIKALVFG